MDAPSIWIPKLITPEVGIILPRNRSIKGWFRAQVFNSAGALVREYERRNLVTNFFFTQANSQHTYAAVGTGSPSFSASSTSLASQTGSRASFGSTVSSNVNASTWSSYQTADFGLGGLNANLTEFGVFTSTSGANMTFCDLIRDSGGSPTTFPVSSAEQLRLTHGVEVSGPSSNSSGSFNIGGAAGSGSHDYEMSYTALTQPASFPAVWSPAYSSFESAISGGRSVAYRGASNAGTINTGDYTAFGGSPTQIGGFDPATGVSTADTSTPGQRTVNIPLVLGLGVANHLDGISGFMYGGVVASQPSSRIYFNPPIPKFAGSTQRILTLNFSATAVAG